MRLLKLNSLRNVCPSVKLTTSFTFLIAFLALIDPVFLSAKDKAGNADKIVSGKVTDEATGNPLAGATVTAKGTNNSTTTSTDGRYSISVKDNNATLVFTFVGYTTKEVPVGNAVNT